MRTPVLAVLLVAPVLGEALSGATPPLDLLLPWNLALFAALYGAGALLCREVTRRRGLGLRGFLLLAAAYGVYEEALVDHYWFKPSYWDDTDVGTYGVVWHTNVLLAVHLTLFHVAVSMSASVLLVERAFPAWRTRAWAGPRGLGLAAVALFVVVPLTYGELGNGPLGPQLAALGLLLVLVAAALRCRDDHHASPPPPTRLRLGPLAFAVSAGHFLLTYAVPSFGVPWPVGLAIALAPVAAGAVVVRRARVDLRGRDGLRLVTGVLAFFAVLVILLGLGGRPDLSLGGVLVALALRRLNRAASLGDAAQHQHGA